MKRKDFPEDLDNNEKKSASSTNTPKQSNNTPEISLTLPLSQPILFNSFNSGIKTSISSDLDSESDTIPKKPRVSEMPSTLYNSYTRILNTKQINKNILDSKYLEKTYGIKYSLEIGQIAVSEDCRIVITSHQDAIRAWKTLDADDENTKPLWTFSNDEEELKFYDKKLWIKNGLVICVGYQYNAEKQHHIMIFILDAVTGKLRSTISDHQKLQIISKSEIIPNTIIFDNNHLIYKLTTGVIVNRDLHSLENFLAYDAPIASPKIYQNKSILHVTDQKIIDISAVLTGEIIQNIVTNITIFDRKNEKEFININCHSVGSSFISNDLLICTYGKSSFFVIDTNNGKIIFDKSKELDTTQSNITDPLYKKLFNHRPREKIVDLATKGNKIAIALGTDYSGNLHSEIRILLLTKIGNNITEKEIENIPFYPSGQAYSADLSLAFTEDDYLIIQTKQKKELTRGCNLSLLSIEHGEMIDKEILKYAFINNKPLLIEEKKREHNLLLVLLERGEELYEYMIKRAKKDNTPVLIMEKTEFSVKFKIFSSPLGDDKWDYIEIDKDFVNFYKLHLLPFQQEKEVLFKSDHPLFTDELRAGLFTARKYHTETHSTYKIYGAPDRRNWEFFIIPNHLAVSLKLNTFPYMLKKLERDEKLFTKSLVRILTQAHFDAADVTYTVNEHSLHIWDVNNSSYRLKKMNYDNLGHVVFDNGILFTAASNQLTTKDFNPPNNILEAQNSIIIRNNI
jgi:hypothetical protein